MPPFRSSKTWLITTFLNIIHSGFRAEIMNGSGTMPFHILCYFDFFPNQYSR